MLHSNANSHDPAVPTYCPVNDSDLQPLHFLSNTLSDLPYRDAQNDNVPESITSSPPGTSAITMRMAVKQEFEMSKPQIILPSPHSAPRSPIPAKAEAGHDDSVVPHANSSSISPLTPPSARVPPVSVSTAGPSDSITEAANALIFILTSPRTAPDSPPPRYDKLKKRRLLHGDKHDPPQKRGASGSRSHRVGIRELSMLMRTNITRTSKTSSNADMDDTLPLTPESVPQSDDDLASPLLLSDERRPRTHDEEPEFRPDDDDEEAESRYLRKRHTTTPSTGMDAQSDCVMVV